MPSKKSEQTVNKVKQLLTTASSESSEIKPNSSQVTKTKSPKTQSLKSIDSKNKTKEEEKEKPTVAIDTQTFMIQVGISSLLSRLSRFIELYSS